MLLAVVLLLIELCMLIGSAATPVGSSAVTLECRASITVSSSLRNAVDRRLLFNADKSPIFTPRHRRSLSAALVALLLLRADVESNPGPAANCRSSAGYMILGLLNVCSAVRKAALIHDVMAEHHLDILAMTETWISSDAPNAVKFDVAPSGYSVVYRHRGSSADQRGGGISLVHRDTIKATSIDVGDYTEFEVLTAKLVDSKSTPVVVDCVYRPPGTVTSNFTNQLWDLFDQCELMDISLVALGDFNVSGVTARQLDRRPTDVFHQHGLQQHVTAPTRGDPASGNILDLILTSDDQPSGQLVSELTVHSVVPGRI